MQCPVCQHRELVESMTTQGVIVDFCPDCSGIWLDRGEVFEFSDNPGRLQRALDDASLSGETHDRPCPRCSDRLTSITFLEDDLWVDFCRSCRGFWFDEGELERAVAADPATFVLQMDPTAKFEADWATAAPTSGTGARSETTDASGQPTSAVHTPAATATLPGGLSALPDLAFRSAALLAVLYGLLALVLVGLTNLGYLTPLLALGIGLVTATLQFLVSPWVMDTSLDWVYSMHWADRSELPDHLDDFIAGVCDQEAIEYPDIGIVHDGAPNAFTYGHTPNNARIVVTRGLLEILDPEEIEAVVAHEIGHARNWDMLVMTVANFVPLVLYLLAGLLGADRRDGPGGIFAVFAFALYSLAEYIVLFLSRTREYHADRYAGNVTRNPNALASALVRIGYGLAGRNPSTDTDERAGGMKGKAFGAFGVFDGEAADAMAIASYDTDDLEGRALADGGDAVADSDIDRDRLIGAMKWDLWNPWAKFYELNSTHPLVAERLGHLSDHAGALDQRPFVTFDVEQPESYWDEFSVDVLVHLAPVLAVAAALIAGLTSVVLYSTTVVLGALVMVTGLVYLGRTLFAYPAEQFPDHSIASCLNYVKVSGIRGVPVSLEGTLIGRGVPGLIYSEDFVLRDETGILFVDYRQPLQIWEFLFGLLRNADYHDQQVELKGWYRRSPVPHVELKELDTGDHTRTSYVFHAKLATGAIITALGIAIMFFLDAPSFSFPTWFFN